MLLPVSTGMELFVYALISRAIVRQLQVFENIATISVSTVKDTCFHF